MKPEDEKIYPDFEERISGVMIKERIKYRTLQIELTDKTPTKRVRGSRNCRNSYERSQHLINKIRIVTSAVWIESAGKNIKEKTLKVLTRAAIQIKIIK